MARVGRPRARRRVRPSLRAAQRSALPAAERTGRARQHRRPRARRRARTARRRARALGARTDPGARMRNGRRPLEWWIAVVRLAAVPLAILQVALTKQYPPGYE